MVRKPCQRLPAKIGVDCQSVVEKDQSENPDREVEDVLWFHGERLSVLGK